MSAARCRWFAVVAGLLVAGACSCDRGQTRAGDGSEQVVERDSEQDETGLEASKGDQCSSDGECSAYLRCRNETCKVPPAMTGETREDTPVVTFQENGVEGREPVAEFYVELATTPEARRTGLMFRPSIKDDWGMLFIYPEAAERSFWMKNTRIPLDMVFVDGQGRVVNIIESAEPMTLTPRPSEGPARYILELNGGIAESSGLAPGMSMSIERVADRHQPER